MIQENIVYIGGTLKTESSRLYLEKIAELVSSIGYKTYLPHRDAKIPTADPKAAGLLRVSDSDNVQLRKSVFNQDLEYLHKCNICVFVLDGLCFGTIFELGYLFSLKKNLNQKAKIIGLYSDIKGPALLDNMTFNACDVIITTIEKLYNELKT